MRNLSKYCMGSNIEDQVATKDITGLLNKIESCVDAFVYSFFDDGYLLVS